MEKIKVRFIANHVPGFAYVSGAVAEVDKDKIADALAHGKVEIVKETIKETQQEIKPDPAIPIDRAVNYAKRGRPRRV